jgi:hypothetical protein
MTLLEEDWISAAMNCQRLETKPLSEHSNPAIVVRHYSLTPKNFKAPVKIIHNDFLWNQLFLVVCSLAQLFFPAAATGAQFSWPGTVSAADQRANKSHCSSINEHVSLACTEQSESP